MHTALLLLSFFGGVPKKDAPHMKFQSKNPDGIACFPCSCRAGCGGMVVFGDGCPNLRAYPNFLSRKVWLISVLGFIESRLWGSKQFHMDLARLFWGPPQKKKGEEGRCALLLPCEHYLAMSDAPTVLAFCTAPCKDEKHSRFV